MRNEIDEITRWGRKGWGETVTFADDLLELLRRDKWRPASGVMVEAAHPQAHGCSSARSPSREIYGDSLDLYSIMEKTKHGVHP